MHPRPQSFASLRETNGTALSSYLRLECRAALAKACDANSYHGALERDDIRFNHTVAPSPL